MDNLDDRDRSSLRRAAVALSTAIVIVCMARLVYGGYLQGWSQVGVGVTAIRVDPTGRAQIVPAKTLWDWLELLVVPLALILLGYWHDKAHKETHRLMAGEKSALQREQAEDWALQNWQAALTRLIMDKGLFEADAGSPVRRLARSRTLAVLRQVDARRKADMVRLLTDTGLISKDSPIVPLHSADLAGTDLRGIDLHGTDLSGVNLRGANMCGVNLERADLRGADLREADLESTDLRGASLEGARIWGTRFRGALIDENSNLPGHPPVTGEHQVTLGPWT